jgi:hypothetical protein
MKSEKRSITSKLTDSVTSLPSTSGQHSQHLETNSSSPPRPPTSFEEQLSVQRKSSSSSAVVPPSSTTNSVPKKSSLKGSSPLVTSIQELESQSRDELKPPLLVTSLDFSSNKPASSGKKSSNNNNLPSSSGSTDFDRVDSIYNRFEQNMKSRIVENNLNTVKENLNTSVNNHLNLSQTADSSALYKEKKVTPQEIQQTLKEIFPSSLSPKAEINNNNNHNEKVSPEKELLRSKIKASLMLSNQETEKTYDDEMNNSFPEREKEYLSHLNDYYDKKTTAAKPAKLHEKEYHYHDDEDEEEEEAEETIQRAKIHLQQAREKEKDVLQSAFQPPVPISSSSLQGTEEADIFTANTNEDFQQLRQSLRPVTTKELEESLDMLKYDIHIEIQEIMHEQVRQFAIAKVKHLKLYWFVYCFK